MAESLRTRLLRWKFNWFPPYRGSGARLTYIAADLHEVRLRLPLNRRTRNLNGTIYGGSIYSAVDPIHAVMLTLLLGPADHLAWTKEARIRFKRQARTALTARIVLEPREVAAVRAEVTSRGKVERSYPVELFDEKNRVCATCEILVHIHTRQPRTAAVPSSPALPVEAVPAS